MKILLDEDVYAVTGRFLKSLNHDVANVYDLGLSGLSGEVILRTAMERQAVLITRDKDFGHLVFVKSIGSGVIYLRVLPSTIDSVRKELKRVLERYSFKELEGSFVVVEPAGHRFRRSYRN